MSDAIPEEFMTDAIIILTKVETAAYLSKSRTRAAFIARALMAADEAATKRERERAAGVALERHKVWETCHPDDADFGQVCDDISACADIAAAILKGEA